MSSFTRPLIVKKIGERTWELFEEFEYHIGEEGSGKVIKVPKGFKTDFASVPRGFWWACPPDGKYTAAAIVHDYLYTIQDRPRKEADKIFLEAMGVLKVAKWKRKVMYRAVRLFGPRWKV